MVIESLPSAIVAVIVPVVAVVVGVTVTVIVPVVVGVTVAVIVPVVVGVIVAVIVPVVVGVTVAVGIAMGVPFTTISGTTNSTLSPGFTPHPETPKTTKTAKTAKTLRSIVLPPVLIGEYFFPFIFFHWVGGYIPPHYSQIINCTMVICTFIYNISHFISLIFNE
jgi:hypothetical protein